MKRSSGVLMHISSLPGDYSIGGFSQSAKDFIDILADSGFTYWQTLPFCLTDMCNSPYQSCSAFGGNPYFVDLTELYELGLLTKLELIIAEQENPYRCEYEKLSRERVQILSLAASRADKKLRAKIKKFIKGNEELEKFCRFMALKFENNQVAWYDWTSFECKSEDVFAWQFIQYFFHKQWLEIKDYANKKGIKLIGDVPIYVSYDSCDVWGNKEQFDLDSEGKPRSLAGCPPDYFSEDGQFWGNPIYDWNHMKEDGFSWWKKRMQHMLSLFDGVRIDHFRAFDTYWSIPAGAESAKYGKWKKGPGKDFIRMLWEVAGDKLIIVEDLGEISDSVKKLLKYSKFPGMRVMQFAFLGERDSSHAPHNYEKNCVAYSGTHDNNTILGFVWESSEENRRELLDYCGFTRRDWDTHDTYDAIIRTLMASVADLVIFPIQDILHYGSDTRMNTPGDPSGNWRFRLTKEQLSSIDTFKYKKMNELYCRFGIDENND